MTLENGLEFYVEPDLSTFYGDKLQSLRDAEEFVMSLGNKLKTIDSEKLPSTIDRFNELEKIANSEKFELKGYDVIVSNIQELSTVIDNHVVDVVKGISNEFDREYSKLKSTDLDVIGASREILNEICDSYFSSAHEAVKKRNISNFALENINEKFTLYDKRKTIITELQTEFGRLVDDYRAITNKADLSTFRKNTKGKIRKTFLKKSKQVDFYEGKIQFENFFDEVNYALKNFNTLKQEESEIKNETENIDSLALGNLDDAIKLLSVDPNKFDDSQYQIYLDNVISSYSTLAAEKKGIAEKKVSVFKTKIGKKFDQLKSIIQTLPKSIDEVGGYIQKSEMAIKEYGKLNSYMTKLSCVQELDTGNVQKVKELNSRYISLKNIESELTGLSDINSYQIKTQKLAEIMKYDFSTVTVNSHLDTEYNQKTEEIKSKVSAVLYSTLDELDEKLGNEEDMEILSACYENLRETVPVDERLNLVKSMTKNQYSNDDDSETTKEIDLTTIEQYDNSYFFPLYESFTGKNSGNGWLDRVDNIEWFVDKQVQNGKNLQTTEDFEIAEVVYSGLEQKFQGGELGAEEFPILAHKKQIARTLNKLNAFIENSKTIYDVGSM